MPRKLAAGPVAALRFLCGVVAGAALAWPMSAAAQTYTEFPIPTASSQPYGITAGPDGALWFTEALGNKIGRITTAGTITEFPITPGSGPTGITAGPDGALWFTESAGNIGRITTAGLFTEFGGGAGLPTAITAGPDGALWFTESNTNEALPQTDEHVPVGRRSP
jgi:streptogramin lyase